MWNLWFSRGISRARPFFSRDTLRIPFLKDALAHLGPYQTLMRVWYTDPSGENTVSFLATIQIKKIPIQTGFGWWLPIVSSKYRHLYQFCYVKILITNQYKNLLLLNDPGRVRSQIASIVRQVQRFDFDRNMVVTRKVIIWTWSPLRLKPL
jgi:hypothetical protein